MKDFYTPPSLRTKADVLLFFLEALSYRERNKSKSVEIARFVYDSVEVARKDVVIDKALDYIQFEFIALEAPGSPPDDDMSYEDYGDQLWKRLRSIVVNEIKRRAVLIT